MKNSSVIRKILYALITILAVIIFNYFLFRVLPGDPISMIMRNPKASEASIEAIRASYGLDLPWYSQFVVYLKGLFTGDFGTSFVYKAPVMEVIGAKILPTVVMLGLAEIVAIIIGIFLGIMAAWKRGSKLDVGTLSFSLITYSMPTFWLGMIMVVIFAVNLRWLPISGMTTAGMVYSSSMEMIADMAAHLILPVITMSILLIGEYALTMRNTLIDVLSEDYITKTRNAQRHAANGDDYRHQSGAGHRRCSTDRDDLLLAGNRQPDVRGSFRQRLSGAAGDFPSRYRLCRLSEPDHGFDLRQD